MIQRWSKPVINLFSGAGGSQMSLNRVILFTGLILFASVTAQAQKVSVGYDHAIDFSKFKTYYWTKGVPAKNPDIDKRIIEMVDQQMTLKGLTRAGVSGDIDISYHAALMD